MSSGAWHWGRVVFLDFHDFCLLFSRWYRCEFDDIWWCESSLKRDEVVVTRAFFFFLGGGNFTLNVWGTDSPFQELIFQGGWNHQAILTLRCETRTQHQYLQNRLLLVHEVYRYSVYTYYMIYIYTHVSASSLRTARLATRRGLISFWFGLWHEITDKSYGQELGTRITVKKNQAFLWLIWICVWADACEKLVRSNAAVSAALRGAVQVDPACREAGCVFYLHDCFCHWAGCEKVLVLSRWWFFLSPALLPGTVRRRLRDARVWLGTAIAGEDWVGACCLRRSPTKGLGQNSTNLPRLRTAAHCCEVDSPQKGWGNS